MGPTYHYSVTVGYRVIFYPNFNFSGAVALRWSKQQLDGRDIYLCSSKSNNNYWKNTIIKFPERIDLLNHTVFRMNDTILEDQGLYHYQIFYGDYSTSEFFNLTITTATKSGTTTTTTKSGTTTITTTSATTTMSGCAISKYSAYCYITLLYNLLYNHILFEV